MAYLYPYYIIPPLLFLLSFVTCFKSCKHWPSNHCYFYACDISLSSSVLLIIIYLIIFNVFALIIYADLQYCHKENCT